MALLSNLGNFLEKKEKFSILCFCRHKFKQVANLLNQNIKTGGVAVLKDQNRFVYYLVTKMFSSGKPTYRTLFSSLEALRRHVKENNVKTLAMPKIGCGLDRLDWEKVKFMIEYIFQNVKIQITICNLQMVSILRLTYLKVFFYLESCLLPYRHDQEMNRTKVFSFIS